MAVGDGDAVTLGSAAPGLGGTMANVLGVVQVSGYSLDGAVTLTLDDSGNTTTARDVTIVDYQGQFPWGVVTGLSGGAGRDLLVAGGLASVLDGGLDEDILIGGTINDFSLSNLNADGKR